MSDTQDFPSSEFPTTQPSVLQEAAGDRWERFWQMYLKPCLREITLQIRQSRKSSQVEPEEILNDFYLALRRPGRFNAENQRLLKKAGFPASQSSNVPGRFLMRQAILKELDERGLPNARFRTLLKTILKRMLVDAIRRRTRAVQLLELDPDEQGTPGDGLLPRVEDSVEQFIDRDWARHQVAQAVNTLMTRSARATTKGRRRFARLLFLKHCEGLSDSEIAERESIHRPTVVEQLADAHAELQRILVEQCGNDEAENLRTVLACGNADLFPQLLRECMERNQQVRL